MAVTIYIVVSGNTDTVVEISRQRLKDAFARPATAQAAPSRKLDPFVLHGVIAQESFLQSKPLVTTL